jgi:hypothetical protein
LRERYGDLAACCLVEVVRVFFLLRDRNAAEKKKEDPHPTLSRKRERARVGYSATLTM